MAKKESAEKVKKEPKAKKAKAAPVVVEGGKAREARPCDYAVLLKPVVTEKSSLIGGQGGGVVFHVCRSSTKIEIREAIERIFKVEVSGVRTSNSLGKMKRTKGDAGRRSSFKKAYVTLKQGHTIDIVEGL